MRGLNKGTGAVVDIELHAGIRVHAGVEGSRRGRGMMDDGQCDAPVAGVPGVPDSGSNARTPAGPAASNATHAPHVESSTPLPLLISRGMPPPTQAMPWLGQRDGLPLDEGWTKLDEGSCGQASALSTRPAAQSCAEQATDLPALLYAAHHVVPLVSALGGLPNLSDVGVSYFLLEPGSVLRPLIRISASSPSRLVPSSPALTRQPASSGIMLTSVYAG